MRYGAYCSGGGAYEFSTGGGAHHNSFWGRPDSRGRENVRHDQSWIPNSTTTIFTRCIGCKYKDCEQIRKLIVEKLYVRKVNEVTREAAATAIINLCDKDVVV